MIPFAVQPSCAPAPLCFDISCSAHRAEASCWRRREGAHPRCDVAFINRRGPRSGDATGDFIRTTHKVSSDARTDRLARRTQRHARHVSAVTWLTSHRTDVIITLRFVHII